MYGQDVFDVQIFLGFPAHILAIYLAFFPLVPFSSYSFLVQLAFQGLSLLQAFFFSFAFLESSSCSSLFFCSSMVDYSSVRVDCPSVAFLFAHLGCLLEVVEGEYLKWVSFFVGEDYPYRFAISFLFPLVSCLARVAKLLKMSKEVRSSELETGLSSPDDRVVPKVTSPSTPYKA